MNGETEENLKNLFEKFLNPEQAEQAAEDIRKGERILRDHAAPEPNDELITGIKAKIAAELLHKRENAFRRMAFRTMAVAAGFVIFAVVSVKLFEAEKVQPGKPLVSSILPETVWESDCLADDSADSATLVAEVEQIENDLLALQVDENGSDSYEVVTELEMELAEINGDFWKG